MGLTERGQTQKCPCFSKGEGFRKVVDLKDCGLVIYCYTDHEGYVVKTEHPTHTVVILQNTKNSTVSSAELLPKLDKNKITCPRCKQILRHAQELLNKVPGIDKQDVMGICDHCRLKARTPEPCPECEKIVHKFLSSRIGEKDTPQMIINQAHSEIEIGVIKFEISKSVDKLRTRKTCHSAINLSQTTFLKKRKHKPLYDLEKGIHFTEFDKPIRIFQTVRSDSTTTVLHVDANMKEISQNTDYASSYKASREPKFNKSCLSHKDTQRETAKHRHDQEKLEVAVKTKKEWVAEFKNILMSKGQIDRDFGLHKDFSFFFPEASQISLHKPSYVSSSQIIRFIQEKIGLTVNAEEDSKGWELQKHEKYLPCEELSRQMEENDTAIEEQKTRNKQEIFSDHHKHEIDREGYSATGKLQKEQIHDQKLIAEAERTRKLKDEISDTTVSKIYTTMKPQLKDDEPVKSEHKKPTKIIEEPYTQRTRQIDETKKAVEGKAKSDLQKTGFDKVPKTPISKEFKDLDRKTNQFEDEINQAKHKDSTGVKLAALGGQTHVTKKYTPHIVPEGKDAVLISERREKVKEMGKSKTIDKSQESSKKRPLETTVLGDKEPKKQTEDRFKENKDFRRHLEDKKMQVKSKETKREALEATRATTHTIAKGTPRISTEKAGATLKSGRTEKEIEKSKNIQHFPDIATREPKRIAEENKTKYNNDKEQIMQVKSDTTSVLRAERRGRETELSQQNLKKIFQDLKHVPRLEPKHEIEKKGEERQEKKKQPEEQAKIKDVISKQKKPLPSEKDTVKISSQPTSVKTDVISKSEPRDKNIQKSKKKETSEQILIKSMKRSKDISDKPVSDKEEKKLQREEHDVEAKAKHALLKDNKLLLQEAKKEKPVGRPIPETVDTKPKIKQKDQEPQGKRVVKKENTEEVLIKAMKRSKDVSDKPLSEKEEKKLQREEQAIEAKAKQALLKDNKILLAETQKEKSIGRPIPEQVDTKPKIKQKDQEPQEKQPAEVKMASIQKPTPSEKKFLQLIVDTKTQKTQEKKLAKIDEVIDPKKLRVAKPARTMATKNIPTRLDSRGELVVSMTHIQVRNRSMDDTLLRLIRIKQSEPRERRSFGAPPVDPKIMLLHKGHKHAKSKTCVICNDSELELKCDIYNAIINDRTDIEEIIIGENLIKNPPSLLDIHGKQKVGPMLFKSKYLDDSPLLPCTPTDEVDKPDNKVQDTEAKKGIIRYALSDRSFIEKGWTLLPTEKVVRKMNVYRMRPAHPEFDWFRHNKHKRLIQYDTSEKFAEFDDNGRSRWYYRNGRLALDYYEAEETNAQQRFVVYSSGEPDERGRTHPITVLATFDYLGNGIVLDHSGKIRLKYNQTEGVVLDRSIGPVSHWKWHTLNDPPVLQQVMIDTQMAHKDAHILQLGGGPVDDKTRPDNEEMLAIEFDNFVKDKNKKLSQKFKPFQIKMKALKINEHFSLRVLDQATIYLIFRDGSTNLKLNIGMKLDHHEIVDTDTAEVGEVSNNLEKFPARTDSLEAMQRSIAFAQRYERTRTERERRLRPLEPCASADHLVAAASRPLRLPLRTVPIAPAGTASNTELCRCSRKPSPSFYYNTRLT